MTRSLDSVSQLEQMMPKAYYECKDKTSRKFWEIDTKGKTVTVRFGKIGSDGQASVKTFATPFEAAMHTARAEAKKLQVGYKLAVKSSGVVGLMPNERAESVAISSGRQLASSEVSADITVRFPLTNSDGRFPDAAAFSKSELDNIGSCCTLDICWEPDAVGLPEDTVITSAEILYDGISPVPGQDSGYRVTKQSLVGYPAPVIRFRLSSPVHWEQFRRAVWTTSVDLQTAAMRASGHEPFHAEDHNGYTAVLSSESRDKCVEKLMRSRLFSGKKYTFADRKSTRLNSSH